MPFGSDAVVIDRVGAIVTENCLVALKCVGLVASVTVTLTVAAPAALGIPVIAPVEGSIDNPAGRPVAVQAYGVMPPEAASGPLYTEPTTPFGSAAVVIVSPGAIVTKNCLVPLKCVGLVASVTVTLTVAAPAALGVPLITPVARSIVNPAGRPVAVHVNGGVPPVSANTPL
jgi:hypothetical protein